MFVLMMEIFCWPHVVLLISTVCLAKKDIDMSLLDEIFILYVKYNEHCWMWMPSLPILSSVASWQPCWPHLHIFKAFCLEGLGRDIHIVYLGVWTHVGIDNLGGVYRIETIFLGRIKQKYQLSEELGWTGVSLMQTGLRTYKYLLNYQVQNYP